MLNWSDIVCFLATKSPEKARDFYERVLELRFVQENEHALVFDLNGTMLRIQKVEHLSPAEYTVLGWRVESIRTEINRLVTRGVSFAHYEGLVQDDHGIWTAPGGAKVAWFKDPDGNILSLSQFP